jgi:hypothetical protein
MHIFKTTTTKKLSFATKAKFKTFRKSLTRFRAEENREFTLAFFLFQLEQREIEI